MRLAIAERRSSVVVARYTANESVHRTLLRSQHKSVLARRRDRMLWYWLAAACLVLPRIACLHNANCTRALSLSLLLSIYPYPRAKRHSQPSFSACLLCTLCLDRVCATGDGVGVIIIWVSFGIQFAIFRDEDRFGILRYSVASESLNSVCCSCCVWFRIRNFYVAYASRASRISSSYSCLRFRVRLSVFYCWFFWVVDEQSTLCIFI